MKNTLLIATCLLAMACTSQSEMEKTEQLAYPETRKDSVFDNYFGMEVGDPYRWLENDTASETESWVKAQNIVTNNYLAKIPYRDEINDRLTELFDYPRISSPFKVGEYFFFYKNDGLQNQAVIYYQKGRDGEPEVFIDPNTFSEDGTVSIGLLGASEDNKYMAYSQSKAGSDWSDIYVKEIETNTTTADKLEWLKFSGAS